jgi:hypothetical protein
MGNRDRVHVGQRHRKRSDHDGCSNVDGTQGDCLPLFPLPGGRGASSVTSDRDERCCACGRICEFGSERT